MSIGVAVAVFVFCLLAMLGASEVLVRGFLRIGAWLGLSAGLLGLITALGTDAPEVSSAISSLIIGSRDLSLGVVFGSNIINLAILLGLASVVAGPLYVRSWSLRMDGGIALVLTLLAAVLILSPFPPALVSALMVVLFVAYIVILGINPLRDSRFRVLRELSEALASPAEELKAARQPFDNKSLRAWAPVLLVVPAIGTIIGASIGLVSAALVLADAWHLPHSLVGAVILAGLTSLPDSYAAIRLATEGHHTAVMGETMNSNSINLLAGISLPVLAFGVGGASLSAVLELVWLFCMTAIVVWLLARKGGLTRRGGASIIAIYIVFVIVLLVT